MRPGDNKWSITIWARDPETGYAKWAYQVEPHDGLDYDEIMENILVDMPWQGQMRKLLLHPGPHRIHVRDGSRNRRAAFSGEIRAGQLGQRLST